MFTFSTTVYDVLWEALDLPPMPARVSVVQGGSTLHDRRRVRAAALVEAKRRGLGAPPALDHRLTELLELIARHTRAVSLRELIGHGRRAYAAADGPRGALCTVRGEQVSIVAIAGDHLVSELLTLLAPLPPGAGRAVTVPSGAFDAAMRAYATDGSAARDVLRTAGVPGNDIERLLTLGRQAVAFGSIGVHRGSHGDVKLAGSLGYSDTPTGRYAIVRRDDHAGRSHTTVIPADPGALRSRVHGLFPP